MNEIIGKRLYISGRVQGVGYRAYFMKHARELALKGWVKNSDNGQVEAVIVGEKSKVKMMLEFARKGPSWSRVDQVVEQKERSGQGGYQGFQIKY